MLELLREQERRSQSQAHRLPALMLIAWAIAWAVGFLTLWSAAETGGNPWFRVPAEAAWAVYGASIAAAVVVSIISGIRIGVGVRGPSKLAGAMYGWSWTISTLGAGFLLGAMARAGVPSAVMGILAPALFALVVGVLYLAGGMLWRSPAQYALGCVMIATAIGASFAGAPTHNLIYGTVGSAAMLVMAVLLVRGILPFESTR